MYYLKYDFLVNNELKIGEYGGMVRTTEKINLITI
jgi:hypothetical protein